jgi:quercetin dioxygenase-like cupin family protein
VNITYHDELEKVSPYPGLTRLITMDRPLGAGAITQGMVWVEPGMVIKAHTHLVEESITLLEGDARVLVGREVLEIRGRRATFLAPANTVHGLRNIGDQPLLLCIAYPGVGVQAFLTESEVEY